MTAKAIYAAISEEYPDAQTDAQLTRMSGSKCLGKLKGGTGIGLKEAQGLVSRNAKWQPLLDWAEEETVKRNKAHCSDMTNVWSKRHAGLVNPELLSPYAQILCGYIQRG